MSPATTTTVKKTTRARKTTPVSDQVLTDTTLSSNLSSKALKPLEDAFTKLIATITSAQENYEALQKELTERFTTEKKLREQEVKSEQELLALKITNLTQENERQENEITTLKKSLENATAQLKDVAVKVIESSSNKPQAFGFQEQ